MKHNWEDKRPERSEFWRRCTDDARLLGSCLLLFALALAGAIAVCGSVLGWGVAR